MKAVQGLFLGVILAALLAPGDEDKAATANASGAGEPQGEPAVRRSAPRTRIVKAEKIFVVGDRMKRRRKKKEVAGSGDPPASPATEINSGDPTE